MAIYNPKSLKAEEFINHEEILDPIRYAEENKHNLALIDEILAKARPVKSADGTQTHCAGLSHREASVLLACDIPEKVAEMYELAEERPSMATASSCLPRSTSPITVSMAACTVRII